jgi:hypothetical protein
MMLSIMTQSIMVSIVALSINGREHSGTKQTANTHPK